MSTEVQSAPNVEGLHHPPVGGGGGGGGPGGGGGGGGAGGNSKHRHHRGHHHHHHGVIGGPSSSRRRESSTGTAPLPGGGGGGATSATSSQVTSTSSSSSNNPVSGGNQWKKYSRADETGGGSKHNKFAKKRSHQGGGGPGGQGGGGGKLYPPFKKRKKDKLIPPTKFLLGGNIRDPLNLNSLQDEEVNRAVNAVTPEYSPLPTPQHRKGVVEVIIPADIRDPLSLLQQEEGDDESYAASFKAASVAGGGGGGGGSLAGGGGGCSCGGGPTGAALGERKSNRKKNRKRKSKGTLSSREESFETGSGSDIKISEDAAVREEGGTDAEARPPIADVASAPGDPVSGLPEDGRKQADSSSVVTPASEIPPPRESPVKNIPKEGGTQGDAAPLPVATVTREFKKPRLNLDKKDRKSGGGGVEVKDRIVSPVIPQPGASWGPGGGGGGGGGSGGGTGRYHHRRQQHHQSHLRKSGAAAAGTQPPSQQQPPNFKEKRKRFQYGNYNRYYGYRNPANEDARLKVFQEHQAMFAGKDVLDIGCNTGTVSMSVARDLGARSVTGLDIDKGLVEAARSRLTRSSKEFPASMPTLYGPLPELPGTQPSSSSAPAAAPPFPHNITFLHGNYVLEDDVLLDLEEAQFDVILCLSVTKWFHLNWGDPGLKRAFRRMYRQLRPGGVLILEPQDWPSYKRKKTLTETIWRNYQSIKMYPTMFTEFLLTEVGFNKCEVISTPLHPQKGFQRPIKVFTKGETAPNNRTPRNQEIVVMTAKSSDVAVSLTESVNTSSSSEEIMETPDSSGKISCSEKVEKPETKSVPTSSSEPMEESSVQSEMSSSSPMLIVCPDSSEKVIEENIKHPTSKSVLTSSSEPMEESSVQSEMSSSSPMLIVCPDSSEKVIEENIKYPSSESVLTSSSTKSSSHSSGNKTIDKNIEHSPTSKIVHTSSSVVMASPDSSERMNTSDVYNSSSKGMVKISSSPQYKMVSPDSSERTVDFLKQEEKQPSQVIIERQSGVNNYCLSTSAMDEDIPQSFSDNSDQITAVHKTPADDPEPPDLS